MVDQTAHKKNFGVDWEEALQHVCMCILTTVPKGFSKVHLEHGYVLSL